MEDHVVAGGFGSAVLEALQEADCPAAVERIGWPDKFIEHGSNVETLRAAYGLSPDDIHRRVLERWRNRQAQSVATEA
jgi:1-deoxy-D-xylulose-5-phosphate synthase